MEHTATPFRFEQGRIVGQPFKRPQRPNSQIQLSDGEIVATVRDDRTGSYKNYPPEIAQANADFIVRACNSYDKMLTALNSVLPELVKEWEQRCVGGQDTEYAKSIDRLICMVGDAIQKAEARNAS